MIITIIIIIMITLIIIIIIIIKLIIIAFNYTREKINKQTAAVQLMLPCATIQPKNLLFFC